jgi:hypothetical protein
VRHARGRHTHRVWIAVTAIGLAFAAASPKASAERPLETGILDFDFTSSAASTREITFDEAAAARAGIAKIVLPWVGVASTRPADPADPGDPAYDFSDIDAAVQGAAAHGIEPMLVISSAPSFAEGADRPANAIPGTWKPSPQALAAFATAVATRYSGAYSATGVVLPRVQLFQIWNEPNLSDHLTPQYDGKRSVAPSIYRDMLNATYAAIKAVDPDDVVITAGTAPYGEPRGGTRTRPLTFWRDLLCLSEKLRAEKCPEKASFNVLAHHPINTTAGPTESATDPNDATTADFKNVVRILRAAESRHTVATRGRHPVWATELWWASDPPQSYHSVSVPKQARWLEQSLYVLWRQDVGAIIYLGVRDGRHPANRGDLFGSGLYFADGRPKPALIAFRFPFVTSRSGAGKLEAWGKAPAGGRLMIERRKGGGWQRVRSLQVREGEVFDAKLRLRGEQRLRATVAGQRSLTWHQR